MVSKKSILCTMYHRLSLFWVCLIQLFKTLNKSMKHSSYSPIYFHAKNGLRAVEYSTKYLDYHLSMYNLYHVGEYGLY